MFLTSSTGQEYKNLPFFFFCFWHLGKRIYNCIIQIIGIINYSHQYSKDKLFLNFQNNTYLVGYLVHALQSWFNLIIFYLGVFICIQYSDWSMEF